MSLLQTALDAFIAPIPLLTTAGAGSGRNPAGGLRRANRLSCRFVSLVFFPPAGTCSLRPSPCLQPAEPAPAKAGGQALGATLRAAIAVQIVCPDDLSLNQTNLPGADLDIRRMPAGCAPWRAHINYGYAFGRRHPLTAQIRPERIWTLEECPKGALQGWSASKIRRDHRINW